jgi:hypothetical protein
MEQATWWRWDPIFQKTPQQWGLRGDAFLWQALIGYLETEPSPVDPTGAKFQLSARLWDLLDPECADAMRIDQFAHGGMSSGYVDKETWRTKLEPLLLRNIEGEFAIAEQRQQEFLAFQEIVLPFAEGMFLKSKLLSHTSLDSAQVEAVRSSISVDIRKVGDLVVPRLRLTDVSVGATETFTPTGSFTRGQLSRLTWQQQPGVDPGRNLLILEHVCPVVSLRELVLQAHSGIEIVQLLWTRMRLAWVTRAEDEKLTELGYEKNRPFPLVAYSEAGIKIFDHYRL